MEGTGQERGKKTESGEDVFQIKFFSFPLALLRKFAGNPPLSGHTRIPRWILNLSAVFHQPPHPYTTLSDISLLIFLWGERKRRQRTSLFLNDFALYFTFCSRLTLSAFAFCEPLSSAVFFYETINTPRDEHTNDVKTLLSICNALLFFRWNARGALLCSLVSTQTNASSFAKRISNTEVNWFERDVPGTPQRQLIKYCLLIQLKADRKYIKW